MWLLNDKKINELPEEVFGFIYRISFSDGSYYIGKKQKEVIRRLPPLKGKKRKRLTKKENWLNYKSSSNIVKERLKNEEAEFEIIRFCYCKGELTYQETKHLFALGCMEDPMCLNENISGKFFKGNVIKYLTSDSE